MEPIIRRMITRSKRYIIILAVIPLILGLVGWFLPVEKEKPIYIAEAMVSLGRYDDSDMNDAKKVQRMLTHQPLNSDEDEPSNLVIMTPSEDVITLSISGSSNESTVQRLNEVIEDFLVMDQLRYEQKKAIIEDLIQALKEEVPNEETKIEQQKFLFELQTELFHLKQASILKAVESKVIEHVAISSKQRGVLGVLVGMTISLMWVVLPEIVRRETT
ncbi:hypothetical protein [Bacillus sp. PS06]|uniref:hypothetical protein n=1 Tax=Bacillus sp. PS06 TaxID=2764176 RepID=UPI0017852349|nr:hypothetical protein [Bacillus sp. PS06]MBD8070884.1 hypothetical protein [Bacillus sp. PS06]